MSHTRRCSRHLSPRARVHCLVAAVVVLAVLLPVNTLYGWKIETHIWIAQQVLNDVIPDGKVTLPGNLGEYSVDPVIWESLKQFPHQYLAGSMGPDAFPDLVGGQMTTHPGLENGWKTDVWLRWIMSRTNRRSPSPELAFAYGYLTHAASDVFGHSYINSYAGDIFVLTDDQEGALRHVAAETFIKDHNPPLVSHTGAGLGAPYDVVDVSTGDSLAKFLRDTFILNREVRNQYSAAGPATAHLVLMHDFWAKQGEILAKADAALAEINGKIGSAQAEIDKFQDQIDAVKDQKACLPFVGCFHIYPAYCFVDPGTCLAVVSTEAALATTKASLDVLKEANTLTANSVRVPIQNWRNDVEEALKQYIITSQEVAKGVMHSGAEPQAKLSEWACKYAPVFAAVPDELTVPGCSASEFATDRIAQINGGVQSVRDFIGSKLGVLGWLVDPLNKVQTAIDDEIKEGLVTDIVAKVSGPNSMVTSLAALRTQGYTAETVNDVFTEDSSGLGLLLLTDVAERIRADMGAANDDGASFDPTVFNPVHNSIVMSKLALLSASELNRLATNAGVATTIYGPSLFPAFSRTPWRTIQLTNVLYDAVASIDGNQQWQEVALPYPRQAGDIGWPNRRYGYAFDLGTRSGGFRFWQDCEARKNVFEAMFRGPLAPSLIDPASKVAAIWESAENPFPFSAESTDVTKVLNLNGKPTYVCGDPSATSPVTVVIEVNDTIPPTIEAPPDIITACTAGSKAGQAVALGDPVAADNIGISGVINDAPEKFSLGKTIVTWTATDLVGLTAQAKQSVTLFDDVSPTFTSSVAPVNAYATSREGAQVTLTPPTATDSCSGAATVVAKTPMTTFPLGETTVIWIATDAAGNTARLTQLVTVTARRGDLDFDGDVDPDDLKILLDSRGQAGRTVLTTPVLDDYNKDGVIDDIDRAVFALIQKGRNDPRDLNGDFVIDAADVVILVQLYTHKTM